MSHYKTIDGKKYEAELLDLADSLSKGSGDGRISVEDAQKLFESASDGKGFTLIEQRTIAYIKEKYSWTQAALHWFADALKAEIPSEDEALEMIGQLLSRYELEGMKVRIKGDEVREQSSFAGSILQFDSALESAIHAFLTEEHSSSPKSEIKLLTNIRPFQFEDEASYLEASQQALIAKMNEGASLSLIEVYTQEMKREKERTEEVLHYPENGEAVEQNWIFKLRVPDIKSTFWAIIDRKGQNTPIVYGAF
ncbi:MAG: hypothetical protein MRZ79_12915 [Bacteroidia bacterium]|nr:hypothetical protein [Bacteroidia bacterium]